MHTPPISQKEMPLASSCSNERNSNEISTQDKVIGSIAAACLGVFAAALILGGVLTLSPFMIAFGALVGFGAIVTISITHSSGVRFNFHYRTRPSWLSWRPWRPSRPSYVVTTHRPTPTIVVNSSPSRHARPPVIFNSTPSRHPQTPVFVSPDHRQGARVVPGTRSGVQQANGSNFWRR